MGRRKSREKRGEGGATARGRRVQAVSTGCAQVPPGIVATVARVHQARRLTRAGRRRGWAPQGL